MIILVQIILAILAAFLTLSVPQLVWSKHLTPKTANFPHLTKNEENEASNYDNNIQQEIDNTSAFMSYTLYTRAIRNNPINITYENFLDVQNNYLMYDREFKFVTHGWMSSGTAESCMLIVNAYLNASDINVIVMDWSRIADNFFYPTPATLTQYVGRSYGIFLNFMVDNGMDLSLTHIMGHSLGAHVSGIAARGIENGQARRLTGFDPALPAFSNDSGLARISNTDAQFVDIIHTSAGLFGIVLAAGTVDFFPNGGTASQPGCLPRNLSSINLSCSHSRSYVYFAESINVSHRFVSHRCGSVVEYDANQCNETVETLMGDPVDLDVNGTFYLTTNAEYPYAQEVV